MKKIFTLIAATFLTVAVFAADRRPDVTLKTTSRNYEVIIDGQSYFGNSMMSLSNFGKGQHSIKVYEVNNSRFRKFKKLVSASSFQLKKSDVTITVDYRGQISIAEDRFDRGYDSRNNDWDRKDSRDRDSHDNHQRNDKNDKDKKRF